MPAASRCDIGVAAEAPEVTPEVWRAMELDLATFSVDAFRTIGLDGHRGPRHRAEAFGPSHDEVAT